MIPIEKLNTSPNFNASVIRRVYVIYWVRKIFNQPALQALTAAVLCGILIIFVSIGDVLSNSPSLYNFQDSERFWLQAFYGTELQTKVALVWMVATLGMLGANGTRSFIAILKRKRVNRDLISA